jgi:hypothetical protein
MRQVELLVAASAVENVPAGQRRHCDEFDNEYDPAEHLKQAAEEFAPVSVENAPAEQGTQSFAPESE